MTDPRYRDPRLNYDSNEEIRSQRNQELESSNAMWGWVAGAVVLALVLMFVFTRVEPKDAPATTTAKIPTACVQDDGGNRVCGKVVP